MQGEKLGAWGHEMALAQCLLVCVDVALMCGRSQHAGGVLGHALPLPLHDPLSGGAPICIGSSIPFTCPLVVVVYPLEFTHRLNSLLCAGGVL